MSFVMIFWLAAVAATVHVAVKLANRAPTDRRKS